MSRGLNGKSGNSLKTTAVAGYTPSGLPRLLDIRVKLPLAPSILPYLERDMNRTEISLI